MPKKILFIYGTRPEAIKLAPLIHEFYNCNNYITKVCVTAQHREMMDQVNSFFNIKPDFDLNLMKKGQDLFDISISILDKIKVILKEYSPDLVFVQGDTSTVLFGALACFYFKIKVAHVEAGLRSENKYSPFPEEINRRLTSDLSTYHFCPTEKNKKFLHEEGIIKNIYVVGNTVIDALNLGVRIIKDSDEKVFFDYFSFLDFNNKIILVTAHRRESFGNPILDICSAILTLVKNNPTLQVVFPVHLNPNVKSVVYKYLSNVNNIFLIEPLDYQYLIWLLDKSYLVLTDSGGIQEEAPALGKPVLVMREVTERTEGVEAGVSRLVGTLPSCIVENVEKLFFNKDEYLNMSTANNPYGDGTTSSKIKAIIDADFNI